MVARHDPAGEEGEGPSVAGGGPAGSRDRPTTDAWAVVRGWRPYLYGAAGLYLVAFGAGVLLGAGEGPIVPARVATSAAPDLAARELFVHNLSVVRWLLAGGVLLGVPTAYGLATNGFVHGAVFRGAADGQGLATAVAASLPHGVLELPALWLAAAVALRWVHVAWQVFHGARPRTVLRRLGPETAAALALVVLALAGAAVVEATVSVRLR